MYHFSAPYRVAAACSVVSWRMGRVVFSASSPIDFAAEDWLMMTRPTPLRASVFSL
jgi:hypothetical protein